MRKNLAFAFLILALIALLTLVLDYRIKPVTEVTDLSARPVNIDAKPAPGFSFTDLAGRRQKLEDFKGRVVILHFWASWCAPCVAEFPKLVQTAAKFRNDVTVLAVSSDESPVTLRRFIKTSAASAMAQKNIYLIWDENRQVTTDIYQTLAYPETIIIDRSGRMIRKIPGDADWTSPEMTSYLQGLIAPLAKAPVKP